MKRFFTAVILLVMIAGCCQKREPLRIMSYNIRIGIGMDDTIRLSRAADVIKLADPAFGFNQSDIPLGPSACMSRLYMGLQGT